LEGSRPDEQDGDDETLQRRRIFARAFSVFNSVQVDGYLPPEAATLPEAERIPHADAFIAALNIPVTFGASTAYYRIDVDPHLHAFVRRIP
jgi:antirestriction protein ArdC